MSKYKEQIARVERYYDRFKQINDGTDERKPSTAEFEDDVFAFFVNCYHIRDWLINDLEYRAHTQRQVDNYINVTMPLAICADICNGMKHLTRNRDPRSSVQPEFAGTVAGATGVRLARLGCFG